MFKTVNKEEGFTLVEIAIAMVIIGLLIGGILKGSELIEGSRVNRAISDMKAFEAAIESYRSKYNAIPGDQIDAMNIISGCNAASHCENGDGNTILAAPDRITDIYNWQSRVAYMPGVSREATQLWKHLALADFIKGVDTNSDPTNPGWGTTHPTSTLGGYEAYFDARTTVGSQLNIMRLSRSGVIPAGPPWQGILNPSTAAMIDRKIDDGAPNSGGVVANYGSTTDLCKINGPSGVIYDEATEEPHCTIFYTLGH